MKSSSTNLAVCLVLTLASPAFAIAAQELSQPALAGEQLAHAGTSKVPACFLCHGPQGKGDGERVPVIAGQPSQYIVSRLHEFQARARASGKPPGAMTQVASLMDESQIQEAAAYLSQLAP
jgi:cytochrome c553